VWRYERASYRKTEKPAVWNLKLSFTIVVITINNEEWWAGLAECGGWRADWCGG
jgi:hypothetical protein